MSLGSQWRCSRSTVSPHFLQCLCQFVSSLPPSSPLSPTAESSKQSWGLSLRAFQASSIFSCQQRVFTGLKYINIYIVGPVAVCKSTSKAMKCAPGLSQGARPSALPGSWGVRGGTAPLRDAQSLTRTDRGALPVGLGSAPTRSACDRAGKRRKEKLIHCILNTHQGTLTALACKDLSTSRDSYPSLTNVKTGKKTCCERSRVWRGQLPHQPLPDCAGSKLGPWPVFRQFWFKQNPHLKYSLEVFFWLAVLFFFLGLVLLKSKPLHFWC